MRKAQLASVVALVVGGLLTLLWLGACARYGYAFTDDDCRRSLGVSFAEMWRMIPGLAAMGVGNLPKSTRSTKTTSISSAKPGCFALEI